MGFLDDVRRAKQAAEAQPEGLSRRERVARAMEEIAVDDRAEFVATWLDDGHELPYVEVLDTAGRINPGGAEGTGWRPAAVEAYVAIVGLRPEDCFGMWPAKLTEGGVSRTAIAYRDRPEYAAGRERFAEWRAAQ